MKVSLKSLVLSDIITTINYNDIKDNNSDIEYFIKEYIVHLVSNKFSFAKTYSFNDLENLYNLYYAPNNKISENDKNLIECILSLISPDEIHEVRYSDGVLIVWNIGSFKSIAFIDCASKLTLNFKSAENYLMVKLPLIGTTVRYPLFYNSVITHFNTKD